MITITEGSRNLPSKMKCECGETVNMVIHHDFIEGGCVCGKKYCVPILKMGSTLWNCCSEPTNGCGFDCPNKIHGRGER